ncbi:MAG: hypothetical protein Q4A15_02410 [Prevotellaceae bacterium]|nr:hypothetical protein [Prevotellaceae bacterium]
MENQCFECKDKREVAVRLIEMIRKQVFDLPEKGEFPRYSSEEELIYEDVPGIKYRIWIRADCYRSEVWDDVEKDSRYVEIIIVSNASGYMLARPVVSGHKDMMLQNLPDEKNIDEYVEKIRRLILDLCTD